MSKNPNIKIFVCYHKPTRLLKSDALVPIHVGRELALHKKEVSNIEKKNIKWLKRHMIGDNTGDNISLKNHNYCELTAIYWAWKNVDADYYGLFHYRRMLDLANKKYQGTVDATSIKLEDFNSKAINLYIREYDAVLSPMSGMEETVYEHYKKHHNLQDLETVINIIKTDYPEYIPAMNEYLHGKKSMFCNLFVMKKELYNEYCDWLFHILFKAEKKIKISNNTYQARVFGFLAERLYNIFISHQIKNNKNFSYHVTKQIKLVEKAYNVEILGKVFTIKNSDFIKISPC